MKNLFFGTSDNGEKNRNGTLFELKPLSSLGGTWTETVLLIFRDGQRDGTALYGGKKRDGAVFSPAT